MAALLAAGILVFLLTGGGSSAPAQTYGGLPSWLPKIKSTAPEIEVATFAKPIHDEEQGYTVHVVLPGASADMTALGPVFPNYVTNYAQAGKWPASRLVPSTFFISFTHVHGTIHVRSADFTVLTYTGQRIPVKLLSRSGGSAPSVLRSGQSYTYKAHTLTLEGQGAIRWAPHGNKILSAWIYQVELD